MTTHVFTLSGEVQDVGLRDLIAEVGAELDRRGIVFNESDGTVRIVTNGTAAQAERLIDVIRERSSETAANIEEIELEDIPADVPLPPFTRPPTDELAYIKRKLGKGVQTLDSVASNTDTLVEGQRTMIEILDERL